jgi:GNAT superfamily N-acetyltransferase
MSPTVQVFTGRLAVTAPLGQQKYAIERLRPEMLEIRVYDLRGEPARKDFLAVADTFLDLLEKAYGDKSIGRRAHENVMHSEHHTVILALRSGSSTPDVFGGTYIRPDGKFAAIAVHPTWQRNGIAHKLVEATVQLFPNAFVQIPPDNILLENIFLSNGFSRINTEPRLRAILDEEFSNVTNVCFRGNTLVFSRRSRLRPGQIFQLVLLSHDTRDQ